MPDQAAVEDHPGYTSVLHPEEIVGSPSMSRVSRSVRRDTVKLSVSNAVPDGTKLQ
jgi:hypothetical protein